MIDYRPDDDAPIVWRVASQRAVSGAILSAIVLGFMVTLVILLMLYLRGQICWSCG
jgi:hypothetical protein